MDRMLRLQQFWSWLPGFRAVAETEHLPTAAQRLAITAPALSRTIRLLEDDIGQPLFDRRGRGLQINTQGTRLLGAVRDAMRLVHEAIEDLEPDSLRGPIHIASALSAHPYVMPVLLDLTTEHADLKPHIYTIPPAGLERQLLEGTLDLAFLTRPIENAHLTCEHLAQQTNGIYCGEASPLWRRRKVSLGDLSQQLFVAPPPTANGQVVDGWPDHLPRRIGMHIAQMSVGLDACARGHYLGLFPDQVVANYAGRKSMRRLPLGIVPPTHIFALRRTPLPLKTYADRVLDLVKENLGST